MKSGTCPRCHSANVCAGSDVPWKKGPYAQYAIRIGAASAAALDRYVCVDCGYVGSYVADRDKFK